MKLEYTSIIYIIGGVVSFIAVIIFACIGKVDERCVDFWN